MNESRKVFTKRSGNKLVVTTKHEVGDTVFIDSIVVNFAQAVTLSSELNKFANDIARETREITK